MPVCVYLCLPLPLSTRLLVSMLVSLPACRCLCLALPLPDALRLGVFLSVGLFETRSRQVPRLDEEPSFPSDNCGN